MCRNSSLASLHQRGGTRSRGPLSVDVFSCYCSIRSFLFGVPTRLPEYSEFVRSQVFHAEPEQQLRNWISTWRQLFQSMQAVNAIFELSSLVIARWEFLGALYRDTEGDTNYKDALAYSRKFLIPINKNYTGLEKLVDR